MKTADETVIFLHVPKTGGTTLQHILRGCYPRNQIWTFKDAGRDRQIEKFKQLSAEKRQGYRLIQGHLSFGFHRHLSGDSIYITLLREPVARALSFYYYARSQPDHYLYRVLQDNDLTLKTLLKEHTATTQELFNLQTRMIAGSDWGDGERAADRTMLERAKEN